MNIVIFKPKPSPRHAGYLVAGKVIPGGIPVQLEQHKAVQAMTGGGVMYCMEIGEGGAPNRIIKDELLDHGFAIDVDGNLHNLNALDAEDRGVALKELHDELARAPEVQSDPPKDLAEARRMIAREAQPKLVEPRTASLRDAVEAGRELEARKEAAKSAAAAADTDADPDADSDTDPDATGQDGNSTANAKTVDNKTTGNKTATKKAVAKK